MVVNNIKGSYKIIECGPHKLGMAQVMDRLLKVGWFHKKGVVSNPLVQFLDP